MIIGSVLLVAARLGLYVSASTNVAYLMFFLVALGAAIKSSAVLVYIRQTGKSFKIDYVVFNLAYCLSGILYDVIHDYKLVYLIGAIVNSINLILISRLGKITKKPKLTTKGPFDWKMLTNILIYNATMLPVSLIFTFMSTVLPKWVIQVIGKDAPVGKIYGSLNPFIILFMVPLYTWFANRHRQSPYLNVVIGTTLSAASLLIMVLGFSPYTLVLTAIVIFTVGEAIWSPNNMEVSTTMVPEGSEGKYLTISLIPKALGSVFMGWFSLTVLNRYVYAATPWYPGPFVAMGFIALLTPFCLLIFKRRLHVHS
jgi:hypothetical protein